MVRSIVSRRHPMSTIAPLPPSQAAQPTADADGTGATVTPIRTGRPPVADIRPILGVRSAAGLSAWMIVMPVDALALVAPAIWAPQHAKGFLAVAVLGLLLLTDGGRYHARLHISVLDELPFILGRLLAAGGIVATAFALLHEPSQIATFLAVGLAGIAMVVVGRTVTNQVILLGRRRRVVAHRTVIVGGGVVAAEVAVLLQRHPRYGLFPIGFVDDEEHPVAGAVSRRLGPVAALDTVVRDTAAEVMIIAGGELSDELLLHVLRQPHAAVADLMMVPRLHQFSRQTGLGDHIGSIPITRIRAPRLRGPAWAVKRLVDVVLSAAALLLCSPLLLAAAVAVHVEGGRGVLFRQERVGRDGVRFTCLKFRSMRPATADESSTRWSIADDSRVGPVGKALRRTGLDELPQLWNILRGDMTLIGPRPERPHFVDQFSREFPQIGRAHV